jgi:hypothetical protein
MGRSLAAFLLTVILLGCGGGAPSLQPVGFVNHTLHSDTDLWAIWKSAQQSVAASIDLNPLQRVNSGAAPKIMPGDPRAFDVLPRQLLVSAQPDVFSATLLAGTGERRADPTGLIACPQPCNVQYAPAYSQYQPASVHYAASWEFSGNNFATLLEYEFENQILFVLGYDLTWR